MEDRTESAAAPSPAMQHNDIRSPTMTSTSAPALAVLSPTPREHTVSTLQQHISLLEIKKALINFSVFLLGGCFLVVAYFNYVLMKVGWRGEGGIREAVGRLLPLIDDITIYHRLHAKPYLPPVFWAVTLSIPLHSMKRQVLKFLLNTFFHKNTTILGFMVLIGKVTLRLLLGQLWQPLEYATSRYLHTVTAISRPSISTDRKPKTKLRDSSDSESDASMSPDRVAVPTLGVLVQDPIEEEELDEEVEANSNTDGLHVNRLPKRSRSSLEQVAEVKRLGSLHTFGSSSTVSSTADLAFDEQPLFNGGAGERNPSPNRRRPSSFKSPRTAASTHSNSYNLRPMTFLSEYSSEKKRRSVSLSEKIAGNIIQQNASGAYMGLLLRCCAIYIAYNVITGISVSAWLTIAAVLAVLVALHITFHLTFLLWTYAVDSMRLTALFAKLRNGVNQVQLWRVSFIAPIRRFFVQQSHAFTRRLKDYIYLNLNMLVTTMLITGFVTASVGLSGFVVFKIGQEANGIADATFDQINSTISRSSTLLSDPELMEKVQHAIGHVRGYMLNWTDEKLQETFPGSNLTINELYTNIYDTYVLISVNTTTVSPTQTGGMTLPVPTSSPLLHMPKTRQLLAALFSGELGFSNAQGLASDAFFEAQAFAYMVGSKLKSQMSHRNASLDGGGTSAALSGAVNYVNEGGRSLLKLGSHSAVFIVNGFSYAFNVMVDYLIFFATLNYLVLNRHSPMHYLSRVLVVVDPKHRIRFSIERSIQAILLSTIKIAAFHSLITWLTFSLVGLEYVYFASLLCGAMAAVPVMSPFALAIPAIIQLLLQEAGWSALFIFATHLWAYWVVDAAIYSEIPDSHHYVAAYSVVLGLWAFGIEGLLLGPILACIPVILFHILSDLTQ